MPVTWLFANVSTGLVPDVYERKPKQVTMHVLPLLWHLLATSSKSGAAGSADLRQATSKLTTTLHVAMGDSLMEAAQISPGMTSHLVQQLQDMLDREASRWYHAIDLNLDLDLAARF